MQQAASSSPIRITFFGDSTCVGQGVSIYRGWVTRIAQDLDELGQQLGRDILVANASVNGRTSRQALEDMPYHVQGAGVDIIVLQFGLNDCNYWATDKGVPRVSIEGFKANLREIMTRARNVGAKHIFLNSNHPTSRTHTIMQHTDFSYEASNKRYNEAIREVAEGAGDDVHFQDMEMHFNALIEAGAPVESFLLQDGLHLSHEGHRQYFDVMAPRLRNAVQSFVNAG